MSAFREQGSPEGSVILTRRNKGGLETPLRGRFYGENKRLIFAPPLWYDGLVIACIAGGALGALYSMVTGMDVGVFAGIAVLFAGIWGALSSERMVCDLRTRRYARMEGQGLRKHISRGSLDDLDALVLTTEQYPHGLGVGVYVIYRLVLYWKGMREPVLVVEREDRNLPSGVPQNQGAQEILQRGMRYAQALRVKYFDNSHLAGRSPVSVV